MSDDKKMIKMNDEKASEVKNRSSILRNHVPDLKTHFPSFFLIYGFVPLKV